MEQQQEEIKQDLQQQQQAQPFQPDEYVSPQKLDDIWPKTDQEKQLLTWIAEATSMDPSKIDHRRIYKASHNYWLGYDFHSRVDEIKLNPTLILIQTVDGDLLGGFTTRCWGDPKKEHKFQADSKCFLFSLTNNKKIEACPAEGEENFGGGIVQSWVHGFYFLECGFQHMWQLVNELYLGNSCDPEYIGVGFKNNQPMCKELLNNSKHQFPKCRYEFKDEAKEDDRLQGDDYYCVKMIEFEVHEIFETS